MSHPLATGLLAQSEDESDSGNFLGDIEKSVNEAFEPIADGLGAFVFGEITLFGVSFPWIVFWLVLAGLVFTVYFKFIQFRQLKLAVQLVRGKYSKVGDPGEITHFQALSSALSGTVGLGNIAGVGVAVTIGGAGATFWMILAGFLGMATKFVECTLGVRYRTTHEDGTISGGPMHYLPKGLTERFGQPGKVLGTILAVLAALMILIFGIGGGNMFQSNQTVVQLQNVTGGEASFLATDGAELILGIVLAVIVASVVVGGIKSIGKVTGRLVPSMAVIYIAACLIVILGNIDKVPGAFGEIFSGAFTGAGVVGGVIGALIVGFTRAAFSNEAGLGSAPIAHSAVKTRYPATEGLVALLEPFIDTIVVCTMTALTIVIANTTTWNELQGVFVETGERPDGVTVTSDAFQSTLPGFQYVLAIAVTLFAISTMITWAYYGQKAWTYLFGETRLSVRVYQVVFCVFIVIGAVLAFDDVISFTNAVMFLLALFNIIGLYLLVPVVKREVQTLLAKVRSGEIHTEVEEEAGKINE